MTNKHLPRHELTLMADDIREEKSNKISLVGIYGADIIFESLPAIYPKLCFCTRILCENEEEKYLLKVSLKDPSGNEQFVDNNEMNITLKKGLGYINNCLSPFRPSKEGTYIYSIFLDGKKLCSTAFSVKKGKIS